MQRKEEDWSNIIEARVESGSLNWICSKNNYEHNVYFFINQRGPEPTHVLV